MATIFCLMGPTASGKTGIAIELVKKFPFEIISVDSAMVYRGMDIGTAKPSPAELEIAPHRLINICDPAQAYSAGEFCQDALKEIDDILAKNRIPLLVGGTMLYFQALQKGLSQLPSADPAIRAKLNQQAEEIGWPALYEKLRTLDPLAANRMSPQDAQRIQRALEVYELTGKTLSQHHQTASRSVSSHQFINLALVMGEREVLHQRIAERFSAMLALGLVEEVRQLFQRNDLHPDLPALRAVGYRQVWSYLAGQLSYEEMRNQAMTATRQLAKRQLTWLRSWPMLYEFGFNDKRALVQMTNTISGFLK